MAASGASGRSAVFAPDVLDGRVALVTGGGSGLGRATALELARCGACVLVAGRREAPLIETVAAVEALGGAASHVCADIREKDEPARIVAAAVEAHGGLDVLVNNAGGQYFVPAEAITAKGWNAVWRLNVGGTLAMAHAAHEAMAGHGGGTIVNVTLSPHHGMPGMAHSGAARAAVESLTRELATRWADDAVAVVAIAAGHFETAVLAKYPEVVRAGAARTVPAGRLGREEEHAWWVALLASPLGRLFNGSVVTVDGARDNWVGPWPPQEMLDAAGEVPTEARRTAGSAPAGGPAPQA